MSNKRVAAGSRRHSFIFAERNATFAKSNVRIEIGNFS